MKSMFVPGERVRCACGKIMAGGKWEAHRKGNETKCRGCAVINYDEEKHLAWLKEGTE